MSLKFLDRLQPLGLFFLRLALGAIMVAHGYHKVFGGLHKHASFVASLGMPAWLGYLSAFSEFLGGILLVVGFLTRLAALAICIDLCVAIFKVDLHRGLVGGYEFPFALAAMAFAMIFTGPGPISADWAISGTGGVSRR